MSAAQAAGQSLRNAAANGDVELVKRLLKAGAGVDSANVYGWTPLHAAAREGREDVILLLLEQRAKLEAATENGVTPLYAAAQQDQSGAVTLLLQRGACLEARNDTGATPLFGAVQKGHEAALRALLDAGGDLHAVDKYGATALHSAAFHGQEAAAATLLQRGANVEASNQNGVTPLHTATLERNVNVVEQLLRHGANVEAANSNGWTPLNSAAWNGFLELVSLLLDHGANMEATTQNGATPLHSSCREGHLDVVSLLLERGADVSKHSREGKSVLNVARQRDNRKVVAFLVAYIRMHWKTLIQQAVDERDSPKLKRVAALIKEADEVSDAHVEKVALPDADAWGEDLQRAAEQGDADRVRHLLTTGASVDYLDSEERRSSIIEAAESSRFEVVDLLLDDSIAIPEESRSDASTAADSVSDSPGNRTHLAAQSMPARAFFDPGTQDETKEPMDDFVSISSDVFNQTKALLQARWSAEDRALLAAKLRDNSIADLNDVQLAAMGSSDLAHPIEVMAPYLHMDFTSRDVSIATLLVNSTYEARKRKADILVAVEIVQTELGAVGSRAMLHFFLTALVDLKTRHTMSQTQVGRRMRLFRTSTGSATILMESAASKLLRRRIDAFNAKPVGIFEDVEGFPVETLLKKLGAKKACVRLPQGLARVKDVARYLKKSQSYSRKDSPVAMGRLGSDFELHSPRWFPHILGTDFSFVDRRDLAFWRQLPWEVRETDPYLVSDLPSTTTAVHAGYATIPEMTAYLEKHLEPSVAAAMSYKIIPSRLVQGGILRPSRVVWSLGPTADEYTNTFYRRTLNMKEVRLHVFS